MEWCWRRVLGQGQGYDLELGFGLGFGLGHTTRGGVAGVRVCGLDRVLSSG